MSSPETPRQTTDTSNRLRPQGPPAESYGPGPGETRTSQGFHSTDMRTSASNVPGSGTGEISYTTGPDFIITSRAGQTGAEIAAMNRPAVASAPSSQTVIAGKGGAIVPTKNPGTLQQIGGDITTGFEDLFLITAQGGRDVGQAIGVGSGSAVVLNQGEQTRLGIIIPAAEQVAAIAAGGEVVGAGAAALEIGAGPTVGVLAGYGAATSGGITAAKGGSPFAIGESALIGAGLGAVGGAAGEYIPGILANSASAGRTASVLSESNETGGFLPGVKGTAFDQYGNPTAYNVPQNVPGPSITQQIAMRLTGATTLKAAPAVETAGGSQVTDISNFPGGSAGYSIQGKYASQDLLQEIEGAAPSGARAEGPGFIRGTPEPPPPQPSTASPAPDYGGSPGVAFGNPGGVRSEIGAGYGPAGASYGLPSSPSSSLAFGPPGEYRSGEAFFQGGGPSGPGYSGGGGASRGGIQLTEQTVQYPPTSSPPSIISRFTEYQQPSSTESFGIQGEAFPVLSSYTSPQSAFRQSQGTSPSSIEASLTQPVQGASTITDVQVVPSTALIQQPTQGQTTIAKPQTSTITEPDIAPGFPELSPTGTAPNNPFTFPGFGFGSPPSDRRFEDTKRKSYGFGVNKNPVGNLLTLGLRKGKKSDFDL